jgi:hypothetical protein
MQKNSNRLNQNWSPLGSAELSREGARLLRELGEPGRYVALDPTDEGSLILRCARDGVSLGGGVSRSAPPRSFGVTISRRRSEHGRGRRFEFPRRGSGG